VRADGGLAVTVRTGRLRNVIGLHGATLYYLVERPFVDGMPEFEIRAATPEDAPFRVLARIPSSRADLADRQSRAVARREMDGPSTH
jgi:hypothetical protein